ncbi:hypothetical protein ILUMI_16038 [Ignelater luminosus]|uniref:Uncharacterized protein n=1 Tax=Ignelater luminosus TaxID=2038154 RepID=A0A8K0CMK4_IGNLU|nr:hypothetical protein ILUMI_16038 [Ignelater luminosus]
MMHGIEENGLLELVHPKQFFDPLRFSSIMVTMDGKSSQPNSDNSRLTSHMDASWDKPANPVNIKSGFTEMCSKKTTSYHLYDGSTCCYAFRKYDTITDKGCGVTIKIVWAFRE